MSTQEAARAAEEAFRQAEDEHHGHGARNGHGGGPDGQTSWLPADLQAGAGAGWVENVSRSTGQVYWFHEQTGESTYVCPEQARSQPGGGGAAESAELHALRQLVQQQQRQMREQQQRSAAVLLGKGPSCNPHRSR
jgi:hypothetical protein